MTTPAEINDKVQQQQSLEALFSKYSDSTTNDGRKMMSYRTIQTIPPITEMLDSSDLLISELDTIWKSVIKDNTREEETIDINGFVQLYNSIDDMFEDEIDDDDDDNDDDATSITTTVWGEKISDDENAIWEKKNEESTNNEKEKEANNNEEEEEEELKKVFATLTGGSTTTEISFSQLWQWDEVSSLVNDSMLDADEFAVLWNKAGGGNEAGLDIHGFIRFNIALDELFDFENDESNDDDDHDENKGTTSSLPMITEQDLPSDVLFALLSNNNSSNNLVGKTELSRWGELMDMLTMGDVTESELDVLFDSIPKAAGTTDMLDEDGFGMFYNGIDNMFEDDDVDDNAYDERMSSSSSSMEKEGGANKVSDKKELKEELLELLDDIAKASAEDGKLMCGLDSSELEQERVLEVVSELERELYNRVVSYESGGVGASKDELVGTWELIYSSSSTMKYNEGLSGLAGGLTRFGGVQQTLMATKYLSDVEYTEQVIGKVGGKSFEVKVTGDWELRTDISLFTGKPSNVLAVTPDKVIYGPRSDKADHWKSLGPMNLLVLSYLDEDLRIMRGNTSTDTLFIWRRN